jgi:hypothetical protein
VNSNGTTIHPSVQLIIIVTPAAGRPGAFAARLEGDSTVLVVSRAPFLAGARKLIAAGYPPDAVFMMLREGAKGFDLKARLGKAAKLTVEESAHGPVFRTVRDGPSSAVAGLQRPVPESRLQAPAEPVVEETTIAFGPPSPVEGSASLPPAAPPEEPRLDAPSEPVVQKTFRIEASGSEVEVARKAEPGMPPGGHPEGRGHGAAAQPDGPPEKHQAVYLGHEGLTECGGSGKPCAMGIAAGRVV